MKRMTKLLAVLAVGAVATAGVVGLAACGEKGESYEGEYHYANAWDETKPDYGVKVKVTVNAAGDTIEKVEIVESNYVQATDSWTETDDGKNYLNKEADLLKAYEGLKVADVLAMKVAVAEDGAPLKQDEEGFIKYTNSDLLISKATQSCGRIVLAVQDALEKIDAAE